MIEIPLDKADHFDVITSDSLGAAIDADSAPTFSVFEEATDTPLFANVSMTKRTSLTGNYRGTYTPATGDGFEVGKIYNITVTAIVAGVTGKATVRSIRVVPAESVSGFRKVDVEYFKGLQTALNKIIEHAKGILVCTLAASGSSTTDIALHATTGVNGGVPSSQPNAYANRTAVFKSGALIGGAYAISAYDETTKILTVATMPTTPDPADELLIV